MHLVTYTHEAVVNLNKFDHLIILFSDWSVRILAVFVCVFFQTYSGEWLF